ncbi:hypothetical protein, partial [uncultured Porphyromonas sp.]
FTDETFRGKYDVKERMKRINITIGFLFIYFVVMSVLGYPRERIAPDGADRLVTYLLVCALELVVLILLRWVLIRRYKMRERRRHDMEQYARYDEEPDE